MTQTVTRTLKLTLESSNRKNQICHSIIDKYNEMRVKSSNIAKTIINSHHPRKSILYDYVANNLDRSITLPNGDTKDVKASLITEANNEIEDAYSSYWQQNTKDKNPPQFNQTRNSVSLRNDTFEIEQSDPQTYALKLKAISYHTEWFKIKSNPYTTPYLQKIINNSLETGSAILELQPNQDNPTLYLTIKREIDVDSPENPDKVLGIDIGENTLYAFTILDTQTNKIEQVEMKSGRQFRHYREQLKKKEQQLQQSNNLRQLLKNKNTREKYTEHTLDTASREIVDYAEQAVDTDETIAIIIEDLTHYRETADNPIHDWPYAEFQQKIAYKAEEKGIPTEIIDPKNTSNTCRKCGNTDPDQREGDTFNCKSCGYQVHSDVNASMNIAINYSNLDRFNIN